MVPKSQPPDPAEPTKIELNKYASVPVGKTQPEEKKQIVVSNLGHNAKRGISANSNKHIYANL